MKKEIIGEKLRKKRLTKIKKIFFNFVLSPIYEIMDPIVLKNFLDYFKNKIVLDAGCGEGHWSLALSKFSKKVFAFDFDKGSIEIAKKKKKRNLTFSIANILNIPFKNSSFDFIWCYQVLEHIKNDKKAVKELVRVLRKGGYLIVATPCSSGLLNYDYRISKFLKKVIPRRFHKHGRPLLEGDIFLFTKRMQHERIGYSIEDFRKIARENNLKLISIKKIYSSKISKYIYEFFASIPNIISILIQPIIAFIRELVFLYDIRKKFEEKEIEGLEILAIFKKIG